MEFSHASEQDELRAAAARLMTERFTDDFRKSFSRGGEPFDGLLWSQLASTGLLGAAIPVEHGGSGLGLTDVCLMLEEQGRTLAAVPLLATLVMGAMPIARFGNPAQQGLLAKVAAGELILTAALEETPGTAEVSARAAEGGWRLCGQRTCVPYALQAQYILIPARTGAEVRVFLVPRDTAGVQVEAQRGTGSEPLGLVTLKDLVLGADAVLDAGDGSEVCAWIIERAQVGLAALQLGVTEEALHRAAAYTSERIQFGRPLGSFQAVQHRLADGYIDIEALRSVYLRAVWALDAGVASRAEVAATKWWTAQCGHRVTHAVQHVHGGLGADVEYPVHAFFLRAKECESALGGAPASLAEIGRELAQGSVPAFTAIGSAGP